MTNLPKKRRNGSPRVPDDWPVDGSVAHPDPAREKYAALVAGGSSQSIACGTISRAQDGSEISDDSRRSTAFKISAEGPVRARVAFLRRAALGAQEVPFEALTLDGMLQIMAEATEALKDASDALEQAGGAGSHVSQLRGDLLTHLGRLNRLRPTAPPVPTGNRVDLKEALERAPMCSCDVDG